jgi:hypothetical protein
LYNFTGTIRTLVNGVEVASSTFSTATGGFSTGGSAFLSLAGFTDSDFTANSTVNVRFEIDSISSGAVFVDFLQLNDELDRRGIPRYRKLSPYDPTEFVGNAGQILLQYNPVTLKLEQLTSPVTFNELTVTADVIGSDFFNDIDDFNDGPQTQFEIAASNDGGQNYITSQNDTNPTFTFSDTGTTIDLKVTLDGYWDTTGLAFEDLSPTQNEGMDLVSLEVLVGTDSLTRDGIGGVNARAIFRPQTITAGGDFVTEGGLFDTDGNMVCRTIAIAPFDPGSDTRVSTDDTIRLVGV